MLAPVPSRGFVGTSLGDGGGVLKVKTRIPDPKTATKERGEKKFVVIPFFVAAKFHKIENYFIFEMPKKNIWANFQRIITFYPKNCH
jgi:hypothetical protein